MKGSYEIVRVDKKNNFPDTVYVTIQSGVKEYDIIYTKGEKKNIQTKPIGKINTIWFDVGGDYGDIEYSIQKIKTGFVGRWTGMFGKNGNLKVRRISI